MGIEDTHLDSSDRISVLPVAAPQPEEVIPEYLDYYGWSQRDLAAPHSPGPKDNWCDYQREGICHRQYGLELGSCFSAAGAFVAKSAKVIR